jgi:tagaturonate reductase
VTTAAAAGDADLPRLDAKLLGSGRSFSRELTVPAPRDLPERVLQFGEGNFLRAFVDWMLARMNRRGLFDGRAVLVQPIAAGMADAINGQDGLYSVVLRGLRDERVVESREIVDSVSRCLDPYRSFDAFLDCAKNPALRFVVSNTTEAGIRVDGADALDARPSPSFPGKLTQLLYARFQHVAGDPAGGLVMLPCELIERNGDTLKRAVVELARAWSLPVPFLRWLDDACIFTNTLVDRIVTGYPKDEAPALFAELGYRDDLLVAGETFHAWVIEGPPALEDELPLRQAGLDVTWTADVAPYRERKVRILNGAHTMLVFAGFLDGKDTVRRCMEDPLLRAYLQQGMDDEILPTLTAGRPGGAAPLPPEDVAAFARSVRERFANPFIKHQLLSIALNSVSKYRARILPTVLDYHAANSRLPPRLTFALASLFAFYRGREIRDGALVGQGRGTRPEASYRVVDEPRVLEGFRDAWGEAALSGDPPDAATCLALARRVLSRVDFWGDDLVARLPGLDGAVALHLATICQLGVRAALERLARRSNS